MQKSNFNDALLFLQERRANRRPFRSTTTVVGSTIRAVMLQSDCASRIAVSLSANVAALLLSEFRLGICAYLRGLLSLEFAIVAPEVGHTLQAFPVFQIIFFFVIAHLFSHAWFIRTRARIVIAHHVNRRVDTLTRRDGAASRQQRC